METPLTGDMRAIAKHVNVFITLPRPLSFNFLGAFELELRGVGFIPQAEVLAPHGVRGLHWKPTGRAVLSGGGRRAALRCGTPVMPLGPTSSPCTA